MKKVQIAKEIPTSEDAITLMEELSCMLEKITGASGAASFQTSDLNNPRAFFVIARNSEGEAIGCGAIRPMSDGAAEIKRVYAKEQGQGIGSQIITYIEQECSKLDYKVLKLETRKVNTNAVQFYLNKGYQVIPNYGKYITHPEAICFEKRIDDDK